MLSPVSKRKRPGIQFKNYLDDDSQKKKLNHLEDLSLNLEACLTNVPNIPKDRRTIVFIMKYDSLKRELIDLAL